MRIAVVIEIPNDARPFGPYYRSRRCGKAARWRKQVKRAVARAVEPLGLRVDGVGKAVLVAPGSPARVGRRIVIEDIEQ